MNITSFETVNITIFNQTFSLKTPSDKADTLRQSARYLHDKMKEISQSTGKNDFQALVVTCALNLIAEFQDSGRVSAGENAGASTQERAQQVDDATTVAVGMAKREALAGGAVQAKSSILADDALTDSALFEQMLHKIRQALA